MPPKPDESMEQERQEQLVNGKDVNNSKSDKVDGENIYKVQIVWRNVLLFTYLHIASLIGLYYALFHAKWQSNVFNYFLALVSTQGVAVGAHRLWSHRAYKAKLPVRILLAIYQTMSLQNHIYEWCRDHRCHHKYADTDADPHNSNRGFFFSHMGWLLVKKHPEVIRRGKSIDLSDLEADPVVMFQKKYYIILAPLFTFVIPCLIPWYCWNEKLYVAWYVCSMLRYTFTLHGTWLVNSLAHMYGDRPYNKNIKATENILVSYATNGEGWHNYHHTFPWDYKAAELGSYYGNWNTAFIDFCAKIGLTYDLKTASPKLIAKTVANRGEPRKTLNADGKSNAQEQYSWCWGDRTMNEEDMLLVNVINAKN